MRNENETEEKIMSSIIIVRIKDEERKVLKKEFLIYESFTSDQDDPIVKNCIEETLKEFNSASEDIDISITIKIEFV